jgi:hypothetical protein
MDFLCCFTLESNSVQLCNHESRSESLKNRGRLSKSTGRTDSQRDQKEGRRVGSCTEEWDIEEERDEVDEEVERSRGTCRTDLERLDASAADTGDDSDGLVDSCVVVDDKEEVDS